MTVIYNIILNGKLKTFEGTEEGYSLNAYVNNSFPVKAHCLVVNDRIKPSKFQLIESEEIWAEEVRKLYNLWVQEKLEFDSKETKEDLFEECSRYLIRKMKTKVAYEFSKSNGTIQPNC